MTITVDDVLFRRTYNEIHAEPVKRDGEPWIRTQAVHVMGPGPPRRLWHTLSGLKE